MSASPRIATGLRNPTLSRRGLLSAAAGLALAACGTGRSSHGKSARAPVAGGTLRVCIPAEAGLAPYSATLLPSIDGNRMSALYDPLVVTSPNTGTVTPHLADSLTPNGDSSVWTLRLRPGVRFSDGTTLDAAAVKYTWEQHANPALHSPQALAVHGLRLDVVSPLELRVTLPTANVNFDHTVSHQLSYVGSPRAMRDPQAFAKNPVGAGPFMLKNWQPGVTQEFVRNPYYWQRGRPFPDRLVFTTNPDLDQAAEVITHNQQDVSVAADPQSVGKVLDAHVETQIPPLDGALYLAFNTRRPPFDDRRARQAFVLALSGEEVKARVFDGYGKVAHGVFSSTSRTGDIQLSAQENDPPKAAALFRQLAKEGKSLDFGFQGPKVEVMTKLGQYLQEKLSAYPEVRFRNELLDMPVYVDRVLTKLDFQTSASTLLLESPDPGLYDFLHSKGPSNISGYSNKVVDDALERARTTTDPDTQRTLYTQVQLQLDNDMPIWCIQEAATAVAARDKVAGIEVFNEGLLLFDRIGLSG